MPENPHETAEERKLKSLPLILVAVAIVLLLIGAYVGAYLGMSEYRDCSWENQKAPLSIVRYYRSDYAAQCFEPAAKMESWLSGDAIHSLGPSRWNDPETLPNLFN